MRSSIKRDLGEKRKAKILETKNFKVKKKNSPQ
jgi:hypothetical protein